MEDLTLDDIEFFDVSNIRRFGQGMAPNCRVDVMGKLHFNRAAQALMGLTEKPIYKVGSKRDDYDLENIFLIDTDEESKFSRRIAGNFYLNTRRVFEHKGIEIEQLQYYKIEQVDIGGYRGVFVLAKSEKAELYLPEEKA